MKRDRRLSAYRRAVRITWKKALKTIGYPRGRRRTGYDTRVHAGPRKTHCKRGHSLADAYAYVRKNGRTSRSCRACQRFRRAQKLTVPQSDINEGHV
jgi:hypothetical protein